MLKQSLLYFAGSAIALLALTKPVMAGSFSFSHKLTAPNGVSGERFGRSVAFDGNYALIGAHTEDYRGASYDSGSAYLFDTTSGNLLHKLTPPDGASGDNFGFSVAIDGNYALVSSVLDDDNGFESGSIYLFDTTSGNLLQKLTAPDGATYDHFGRSVAIDGNYALIGAYADDDKGYNSGSAYLFDITNGNLLHKLTAPDGAVNDLFGLPVALDGNHALIGSFRDDDNGSNSGSAYLFDTTSGNLLHKLTAPDGASDDIFGLSVALDGNSALIGAYNDDDNGSNSGSAYLFDTTSGNLLHKLTAPDGSDNDRFGFSVALNENSALIGSFRDEDNGIDSGSAYLFDTTSGNLLQKLTAPDGASGDYFGYSVALDGNSAFISAILDDDNGINSGSVYVYKQDVPEPASILGLLAIGGLGASSLLKRKGN